MEKGKYVISLITYDIGIIEDLNDENVEILLSNGNTVKVRRCMLNKFFELLL